MRRLVIALFGVTVAGGTGLLDGQQGRRADRREPIVGLPCEGCEAVFDGLPEVLTARARIGSADEPGEPMRIEGTVVDAAGRPASGVIVYAYQTDAGGEYPPDERFARGSAAYRHGRLRAWVRTGPDGRYRFETIRPGSYPSRDVPAHIHMHVIEPGCCTYYLASIHFTDDPLVSDDERERFAEGRGGSGLVRPERDERGVWVVRRDIRLGERVPGYPRQEPR